MLCTSARPASKVARRWTFAFRIVLARECPVWTRFAGALGTLIEVPVMFNRFLALAVTMALVAASPAVCCAADKAPAKTGLRRPRLHTTATVDTTRTNTSGPKTSARIRPTSKRTWPSGPLSSSWCCWACCGSLPGGPSRPASRNASGWWRSTSRSPSKAKRKPSGCWPNTRPSCCRLRMRCAAIVEEARRHAEQTTQEILAKARADAEAEMVRAKHEIDVAKDQALTALAQSAADHAVDFGRQDSWRQAQRGRSPQPDRIFLGRLRQGRGTP